jgi:hypothetical protein
MAGEQALSQTEILQKLERVGNLESVVTEQRMRMEKLKTTYEMLKAEHIQLQEVCKLKFLIYTVIWTIITTESKCIMPAQ